MPPFYKGSWNGVHLPKAVVWTIGLLLPLIGLMKTLGKEEDITLLNTVAAVQWCHCFRSWHRGPFHYHIKCLIVIYRKVSKAWDSCLSFFYHFGIWQAFLIALLSRRHPNTKTICAFYLPISRVWDFARTYDKTTGQILKRAMNVKAC